MNIWQDRIRGFGAKYCPEDLTDESGAACTASVWLAVYGVAIVGSIFLGSWLHKNERPVISAALAGVEHSK
jgi:hypothetical protein